MTASAKTFHKLVTLSFALGVLGGAVLVLSQFFLTPGKYILVPFALVVLGIIAAVRAERVESFWTRFSACLVPLAVSSLALYLSVALSLKGDAINFLGHAARLVVLLLIGVAVSLAAARLSRSTDQPPTLTRA